MALKYHTSEINVIETPEDIRASIMDRFIEWRDDKLEKTRNSQIENDRNGKRGEAQRRQVNERNRLWVVANPKEANRMRLRWADGNLERCLTSDKKWRQDNPHKSRAYTKKWRQKNPEKHRAGVDRWQKENIDRKRFITSRWAKVNPDKSRAKAQRRLALQRKLFHPGIDNSLVKEIFAVCVELEAQTGIPHEVDHIIPLARGGWHHHLNLQALPETINARKHANPFWEHPNYKSWRDVPEFLWPEALKDKYAEILKIEQLKTA